MLTLISVFNRLAQLPSRFCQIQISQSRIGQTVEHSKFKATKPSLSSLGTPCNFLAHAVTVDCCIDFVADTIVEVLRNTDKWRIIVVFVIAAWNGHNSRCRGFLGKKGAEEFRDI